MTEAETQYLSVPHWEKYQPRLKNGKPNREWIRFQCHLEDGDIGKLNMGEYTTLTTLWRIAGRTGKWPPNDADWVRRRLPSGQHTVSMVRAWLEHIVSIGLLVICNQQNIEELAPRDVTRRDETLTSISPPSRKTEKKPPAKKQREIVYTSDFLKLWEVYPRKDCKLAAFTAFKKSGINGNLPEVIQSVVEHKTDPAWQRESGKYIPHLSTYLNGRRWEDEPDEKIEFDWGAESVV